jgi:hypothetical protein
MKVTTLTNACMVALAIAALANAPAVLALEVLKDRTVSTIFTVNSLADDNIGEGNAGDLRYVINRANALNTGTPTTPNLIQFTGVTLTPANHTIYVGAGAAGNVPLPALTAVVTIDATTAGGFYNSNCNMSQQTGLMLTLDGQRLHGGADGLTLQGGNSTVHALKIINFPDNGILVTSSHNTIGGDEVGFMVDPYGNCLRNNPAGRITTLPMPDPPTTAPVFVRPPQGNVISANGGTGVLIVNGADSNLLQGNFIGTDVTGLKARGNGGDGVAIINSDNNKLFGTTPIDQDNPFVFYNVISGNKGNGLVVDSSDHTKIYANFFGLGADNNTPLGNHLNGVLIKGTSDRTRFGLNIPLGNVTAANGQNGVKVRDSASRTLLMNTFSGVAAFNPSAQVGNHRNGVLITSDGGGTVYKGARFTTLIVTCDVSGNDRNGLEISGNAVGVQVSQSVIGMQTNGNYPQPNQQNGIEISGNASGIDIGGFEPSVIGGSEFPDDTFPENFLEGANLISGNLWNGVAVGGNAQGVTIVNSFVGTDITSTGPAGNGRNGIFLDGSSGTQVGLMLGAFPDPDRNLRNIIAFNSRDGILVGKGAGNSMLGNSILSNERLGINLRAGGNQNQAAPVLTSAQMWSGGATQVTGTIAAQPNTTYQIEIFASQSSQPGSGQNFLGFANIKTNPAGFASFTIIGLVNPDSTSAKFITTTMTSPAGNTSEFSNAIRARHNG